jgi:hypothetical protein
MHSHPKGYIALISVLLISTSLLVAVISLSFTGYLNRFVILEAQLKEDSLAYAEACASTALGEIARNQAYAPLSPVGIRVDADAIVDCYIESVTGSPSNKIITAINNSTTNKAISKVQVTVDATTLVISSWNEVP